MKTCSVFVIIGCLLIGFAGPAAAQAPQQSAPGSATVTMSSGTIVSVTRATLLIRNDAGNYELYVVDQSTTRPAQLTPGAKVAVTAIAATTPGGTSRATIVRVTQAAPAPGAAPPPSAAPAPDEPVPASIRQLESSIKKQTRRYHVGVIGGVALDPELVLIGANGLMGPFFSDNVWFRPGLDFGFGEVTTLVAFNLEMMYRLPVNDRGSKWNTYAGVGPAFNFAKRGLPNQVTNEVENRDFSFSDLNFDGGLNVFIGVQSKDGMSLELKASAYSEPHLRILVGFAF